MERTYTLLNHVSSEVTCITSAHSVSRPHLAVKESRNTTHVSRKVETDFGELTVGLAMEMHCSKSLKLTQIKLLHSRAESLGSLRWAPQSSFYRTARRSALGLNRGKREKLDWVGRWGGFQTDVCKVLLRMAPGT